MVMNQMHRVHRAKDRLRVGTIKWPWDSGKENEALQRYLAPSATG